ncbi:MAG TPA: alpha/beta fold hydrolase [Pyrinomonadaceae bacterium]|jgi:medium-chain acyl-[acyl-carrier-protein] hydrolase
MSTSITNEAARWFVVRRPNPRAALRLFCFPYAGGGTPIYRQWPELLPPEYEVYAAQLPGRGNRMREPPYYSFEPMVEALASAVAPHLDRPFAFFGHSMGATIGFELARLLEARGAGLPARLFVSGRRAPQLPRDWEITYNLPEPQFISHVQSLNGTPAEVLEHPELMELMLPLLRADFSVVETYEYRTGPPLGCPITAFGGAEDAEVDREKVAAWREQTSADFNLRIMPGGHFFLSDTPTQAAMLRIIESELRQAART